MSKDVRDNWWRMMKKGRYRALRNLPAGWVIQVLHGIDRTERWSRIILEIVAVLIMSNIMHNTLHTSLFVSCLLGFMIVHTLSWFFVGNFWVYMLDSFQWVKNPGIDGVIRFVQLTRRAYERNDSCDAILIYGSMCRRQFHGRSDLDLRIVRRRDSWKGYLALITGILLRIYSFFIVMPVDFQVVDSMNFLIHQMREDERPIVVYQREGFHIENAGVPFEELERNPNSFLRDN